MEINNKIEALLIVQIKLEIGLRRITDQMLEWIYHILRARLRMELKGRVTLKLS